MNPVESFLAEVRRNIEALGKDLTLQGLSNIWLREGLRYNYSYNFTWLGRPIIQYPQDVIAMQEIIWQVKPNLIIETGIAHGGSLIFYASMLELIGRLALNYESPETKNTYWMVSAIVDRQFGISKERLMELMDKQNIDCRPFFHPLSSIPAYQNLEQARQARERNKNAYKISPYGINLPSGLNITKEKVDYVCKALKEILHLQ